MNTTPNRRKVLIPLATVLAAGTIAVGSGATFTSTTNNTISSVTSGTLKHTNSKDAKAIFDLTNMKPGDILNGSLILTNTGSLPAAFSLTEVSSSNGFTESNLTLTITDPALTAPVYTGTFGGLTDGAAKALGTFEAGEVHTYNFSVKLAQATPNTDQGKTATAVYQWNSTQLDATTYDQ